MLGRLRVSILGLMAAVVAVALAFAALRTASDLWFSALYTFTTVLLLWAVIAARFGRRGARAFWFGFAVFGWGFYLLEMGPWTHPFLGFGTGNGLVGGLNHNLLTSRLVLSMVPHLRKGTDDLGAITKITLNTVGIAHLLVTLALALVGGTIAALLRRRRGRAAPGRAGNVLNTLIVLTVLGLGIAVEWSGDSDSARPLPPFFPAAVRDETKGIDDSDVERYSKHLDAMGERPLWILAERDRSATVYRLLWLPTFHHPVCVRIGLDGRGASLHARVLEGYGGYEPGQVAIDKDIPLSDDQWWTLKRRLEEAAFWDMPTQEVMEDLGTGDFGIGGLSTDGDDLIIEGVRGGIYHVVDRGEAEPAYATLCRTMLDLAGLKVEGAWADYH